MKKKYVVIFSVLIIVSVLIYIYIPKTKEEIKNTETKENTNGFLTLMLEQDDGTYKKSNSSLWPETGYIFNDVLSKCENGGELIWNDELKTITLKTNKSDKCYVYFDILEIFYKYNASTNGDSIYNNILIENVFSNKNDEILLIFNEYENTFDASSYDLIKSGNTSNKDNSLNYGFNSIIYINDSLLNFKNANLSTSSNYSPFFYINNSTTNIFDCALYNYEFNDIFLVSNNSNITISNLYINTKNDLNIYINGDSNSLIVDEGLIYNVNNTSSPLNFILNQYSQLLLTNKQTDIAYNINLNANAELVFDNNEYNIDINVSSDTTSIAYINNYGDLTGCFNSSNNSNFNISLENLGELSLSCNSYISTIVDNSEFKNINSNGYNLYYDSEKNPELNGTINLNGGGKLIPY